MVDKVKSVRIGTNIRAKRVGDDLILRINLAADGEPSKSGKAILIAKSGGFANLVEVTGEEVGLNLILSKRAGQKKAATKAKAAPAKPAKKAKSPPPKAIKPKRRAKRDDDDD